MDTKTNDVSRRGFLKASAAVGAASLMSVSHKAYAQGSDKIRVGLIGCGGRGMGAGIIDCAASSKGVELVALGDVFQDKLDKAPNAIKGNLANFRAPVPDGKVATTGEVAAAVLFLLSDQAGHITMEDIVIDGGATMIP